MKKESDLEDLSLKESHKIFKKNYKIVGNF